MLWWIGACIVWLISAVWIVFVMADVFRRKHSAFSPQSLFGYAFHGVTAILALWMVFLALGS